MNAAEVKIVLQAQDQASHVIKNVQGSLGGLHTSGASATQSLSGLDSIVTNLATGSLKMLGTAAAAAVAAVSAATTAVVVMGIQSAGSLQQAVANISTIKMDIDTSAVFAKLNEMQTRIPQTAKELGDSLYDVFSSMDVGTEDAFYLVEQFSKGAVGAQTDAKTFGTAVMGVMNAYKMNVNDAAHVSDVFFNTVRDGVVTGPELAASLGLVVQAGKLAGSTFEETMAMIVGATKEGGPAAQNINNLANLFMKINTSSSQEAINKLGIATVGYAGQLRAPLAIMADLNAALSTMTGSAQAATLQAIFPDAQARAGAQVIMSELNKVGGALQSNVNDMGAADAAYTKMSSTFQSQSKLLGNSFDSIKTKIGAELLPMLTPLVTKFADELPAAFQAFSDKFKETSHPELDALLERLQNIKGEDIANGLMAVALAINDIMAAADAAYTKVKPLWDLLQYMPLLNPALGVAKGAKEWQMPQPQGSNAWQDYADPFRQRAPASLNSGGASSNITINIGGESASVSGSFKQAQRLGRIMERYGAMQREGGLA